jgi:hypothetical protein
MLRNALAGGVGRTIALDDCTKVSIHDHQLFRFGRFPALPMDRYLD